MSVRRCMEEIDAREFAEWVAYDRREPIGDQRADYLAASICKTIGDVNRKPGQAPYSLRACLLTWGGDEEISPKRQREIMQAWAMMHNAAIARRK